MIITGPRLRMRPLQLADWLLMAETFHDWPADAEGSWTMERAQRMTDFAVRTGLAAVPELAEGKTWRQALVLYTDATPTGVGIVVHEGEGMQCHVLQQAVHPAHRGRGYFSEANHMLEVFAFAHLGAESVTHELLEGSVPARAWVASRERYGPAEDVVEGQTGALLPGSITRADWEAWADANPDQVPAITVEA